MIPFFQPRYVKEARLLVKNARKILAYKRDLLAPEELSEIESLLAKLEHPENEKEAEKNEAQLERLFAKRVPVRPDAAWRENCEVFLVAIIIAISIRTYFIQPFTIPTGSMQPTLNGIIGYSTPNEPPAGIIKQAIEFALFGRTYIDVVAREDDTIEQVVEVKRLLFLTYTEVRCTHSSYVIHAPRDILQSRANSFNVEPGNSYRAGDVIVRGHIDTGDHVFVDKISYNFRRPARGEVFVFKTTGITEIERGQRIQHPDDEEIGSQFYIKRLAGLPGDELRIDPPSLYINGSAATEPGFLRVMEGKDGYHGYSNGPAFSGTYVMARPSPRLGSPESTFRVPMKNYFALGDNSFNSSDGREWGTVPQRNIMGCGLLVYWPFTSHWGLIR